MESQIVTCSGLDCSICGVFEVISNLFRYLMGISGTVAVILLIIAGFLFILGLGKEKEINQAKTVFKYAVFGFIVTLVSFLVIYSLYRVSGARNSEGWYQVKCDSESASTNGDLSETAYLSPSEGKVVSSGSLSAIASGDKNIVRIDARELDIKNLIADINILDPEQEINFITGPSDFRSQYLIDYRNLVLGYKSDMSERESDIDELFSVTTTDADGQYIIEPKGELKKFLGDKIYANKDNLETITKALKKVAQISNLGGKDVLAYTSGDTLGDQDVCIDSGGEFIEFKNQCLRDKEKYASRDIVCSEEENPVNGCNCPNGYYLDKAGKCVIASKLGKSASQIEACKDVFLEQKKCPISRCEGDKMMIYPASAKDECIVDSKGKTTVKKKSCVGTASTNASENQKCLSGLNSLTQQQLAQQAQDYYNKTKQDPSWYEKLIQDQLGKGSDVKGGGGGKSGSGSGNGTGSGTGTGGDTGTGNTGTGSTDTGPLPPDQGAGNFNPTPKFQELKECIGLKGDQIPYNGILVVLLNPIDSLNRKNVENISKMFYLSRNGEIIGKNGEDLGKSPMAGGQEYGARTFDKSFTGSPNGPSMWGRGWKIFKGPSIYAKQNGSYSGECSFGSQYGYKTGTSEDALNPNNLRGGKVTQTNYCGQHSGKKYSSAGCATMGNNSRCGFIKKSKSYMTQTNGTIMQINFVGSMDSTGRFSSPDCGKIDYCSAKKTFENSPARSFRNNPNEGYQQGDKRMVNC